MLRTPCPVARLLLGAGTAAALALGAATQQGSWSAAFDHEVNTANTNQLVIPPTHVWPPQFNAIHMALIPVGPYRGHVLVWDKAEVALRPYQRWSIIDPTWTPGAGRPRFRNFFLGMPQGAATGDLFCAGHAWMRDGRLFVAGGTATYPVPPNFYFGAALVYQFAPDLFDVGNQDFGVWKREPDLAMTRWYPTVTVLADDSLLVTGGSDNSSPHNDYEVYRLTGPFGATPPSAIGFDQRTSGGGNLRVYDGPTFPGGFADYPRVHLLTTGQSFCSGWFRRGFKWRHDPGVQPVYDFTAGAGPNTPAVTYASSVLDPRSGAGDDKILRIGGSSYGLPRKDVDSCDASAPGNWIALQPPFRLNHARWMQNAVLLPTGEVFVFGGFADGNNPGAPELRPELLTSSGWVTQPTHVGGRGYHATAVLLPDGRVFCGGADMRSVDYQIYSPPYLLSGNPRPKHVACDVEPGFGGLRYSDEVPDRLYSAWWDEGLPASVRIEQVVLIRPGSVTHHSDMDTRLVRLEIKRDDDVPDTEHRIRFRGPKNSAHAPRGFYMLFLVTNQNVPSEAVWVHVQ